MDMFPGVKRIIELAHYHRLTDGLRNLEAKATAEVVQVEELMANLLLLCDWDDGCMYINGRAAPELQTIMDKLRHNKG